MLGEAGFILDQSLPLLTMHLQNAVWVQIVFRSDHDPDFDPDSEELVVSVYNGKTQFILEYDHIAQDTEDFGNKVLETIRTLWCQKPLNP